MWTEDVPLFVTGRLASLRLGPGAGNLAGARVGAGRITWRIEDVLGSGMEMADEGEVERFEYAIPSNGGVLRFCGPCANAFSILRVNT